VEVAVSDTWTIISFPKSSPRLVLTSKPVPVQGYLWGFYDYKKSGVVGSTVVHILTIAAIVGLTIAGRHVVQEVTKKQEVVTYVATDDIPPLPPAKTISGGGGGGGDRDKFQASERQAAEV